MQHERFGIEQLVLSLDPSAFQASRMPDPDHQQLLKSVRPPVPGATPLFHALVLS